MIRAIWAGDMAQDGSQSGLKTSLELKAYWQGNCSVYSPAQTGYLCQYHASCLMQTGTHITGSSGFINYRVQSPEVAEPRAGHRADTPATQSQAALMSQYWHDTQVHSSTPSGTESRR